MLKLKQSRSASSGVPAVEDTIKLDKHGSPPLTSSVTRTPSPAGIDDPVSENPRTVDPPVEMVNPASCAAPPPAPLSVAPSTVNWKPPMASLLLK